jgi:CubicO group peptidase (beta-lactamase class C family)
MGKTFTATLVMQLVQEGRLSLSQTIRSVLPESPVQKADSITIRHLLTHTSGVGNYMAHPKYEEDRYRLHSLEDVMPYVTEQAPTLHRVGEAFDYSNSGFIILGRIIEKITGKSYARNLQERIFEPAGITNSYIHYPATFNAPAEATPYFAYTTKTFLNGSGEEFPGFSDGGMQSNAPDLLRFAHGVLSGKIVQPAFRDSMWKGRVDMGRKGKYGYGWIDNENEWGKHIYSHDGGGKGFSSDLKIVADDGTIIIVLINNRVNPREVSNNILGILYNGRYQRPEKYPETILMEVMEEKGFAYVQTRFKELLKERGYDKTPDAWVYIKFSDMLESLKEMDNALKVCAMGRAAFPREVSLYNVTGQLYMNQQKYTEAKEWFGKALNLDPADGFARMMLESMAKKSGNK